MPGEIQPSQTATAASGFASGPVLALAAARRRPTMLLEQNAQPGLTNRLLAPLVRAAAVNFEEALRFFPRTGFVAGNPVRPEFFQASLKESNDHTGQPHDAARVLIFGGSQGAHAINVAMVEAAARLAATGVRLAITQQTGERDLDLVRAAYERAGLEARVEAFIDQIDGAMRAADLVICRAGATTLAELTAAGRPAILEARAADGEPQCAKHRSHDTNPDQARALIVPPEEETTDRNEIRGEEKFNRQVECRGESDPDEPASAQIDEWHSRADPGFIHTRT